MNITVLMALLTSSLPFLMKLGEKTAESAVSQMGEDAWETAKKIWSKLHPQIEAKPDAKKAVAMVVSKPDSKTRQAVLQEELEILLDENPDLKDAIAKILADQSESNSSQGIQQNIKEVKGQVIGQMTDGQATGIKIEGGQENVNF